MPDHPHTDKIIDVAFIDQLEQAAGPQLAGVMHGFLHFIEDCLPRIEQAAAHQESVQLTEHAHSLKGSAANLGARSLSDCAALLEAAARTKDWLTVNALIEQLHGVAEQTQTLLRGRYEA